VADGGRPVKRGKAKRERRRRMRIAHAKPPVGSRPGTLVLPPDSPRPRIRAVRYTAEHLEEREIHDPRELKSFCQSEGLLWVDVQGLGDRAALEWIGENFGLHPLVLADITNLPQRPKSEAYEGATFTIARRFLVREERLEERQISIVIGPRHVLSFQEREDDVFEPVRARLVQAVGLLRRSGSDYLAYALLDALVDGYFPVMDWLGEKLERLEQRVVEQPVQSVMEELSALRADLLDLRRDVWPQREALNALLRGDAGHVTETVRVYLRDVYDHCVQVAELLEVYRELAAGLMNLYLSALANRTNDVMRVLTVVSTIFIPLTFLVGVYGMNFRQGMPELDWPWAYPVLWGLMLVGGVGMALYFRRRGWLGRLPD